MSEAYESILAALDSIPWERAPSVTPIKPRDHRELNFFPGQKGFVGPEFPFRGVLIVANNFDNLTGWEVYCDDLDYIDDQSPTWRRLNDLVIPSSGIPRQDFWFTNYCLGVMDKPKSTYRFPKFIREDLKFDRVFEKCVAAMQPRLVVSLGGLAADCLGIALRPLTIVQDDRVGAKYGTRVLAGAHPSARASQGYTDDYFQHFGRRIGQAAEH